MKTLIFAFALALAVLALDQPLKAATTPFEIDAIVSMTGSGSFLGTAEAEALRVAESYINRNGGIRKRPIKFVIRDDQSSPQIAVQLFNEILQRKPHVVLGSTLVAACSAIAPLIHDGPVVYCFSAGMRPPAGSYMFAYGVSTAGIMTVLTNHLRTLGWTRIGTIFTTDASGQDGEQSLNAVLSRPENKNLTIVDREHYNTTDIGVSAQLARLKSANAQIIVAWGTGTPLGTVLRGANDIGLNVPFAVSAANADYSLLKQYASFLPRDLFMVAAPGVVPDAAAPGPLKNAARAFFDATSAAGIKPDSTLIDSWDPAFIVVSALRALGADADPDKVRQYIANLHGWYGAAGVYDFRDGSQRGLTGNTSVVVRFDAAKQAFVPVSGVGGVSLR